MIHKSFMHSVMELNISTKGLWKKIKLSINSLYFLLLEVLDFPEHEAVSCIWFIDEKLQD